MRGDEHYTSSPYSAPHNGTLYSYVEDKEVYLCPKVERGSLSDPLSGNGMFDYTMMQALSGIKVSKFPRKARYNLGGGAYLDNFPMSVFIEESLSNSLSIYPEGGFGSTDRFDFRHNDRKVISKIDGSVSTFEFPGMYIEAKSIEAVSPSKSWVTLQGIGWRFGDWSKQ